MACYRGETEPRILSSSGQSTLDYLTVPDHDLLFILPQSPGSLSMQSLWTRNNSEEEWRRTSSTASSIFDLSNEAEQLEHALQENDVYSLSKILKLHHTKFPVQIPCSSLGERYSFDSRSQRLSHGSQTLTERTDRRESVATDASDVPAIFRTSLHVAIQNDSMDVLMILLKYGIDPNMPNQFCYTVSRRNSTVAETSYPYNIIPGSSYLYKDLETNTRTSSTLDDRNPPPYMHTASSIKLYATPFDQQNRMFQRDNTLQKSKICETTFQHNSCIVSAKKTEVFFDFSFNYSQDELFGLPVLYLAIVKGSKLAVQHLLHHGASPNVQDRYGVTPLHLAACTDFYNAECVQYLIKNGAKIHTQSFFGMSAYNLRPSLETEQVDMVREMMAVGPLIKAPPNLYNMGASQDSSTSSSSVSRFFKRLNNENKSSKIKDKRITLIEGAIDMDIAERASTTSSYRSARSRRQSTRFSITEDTETDVSMVGWKFSFHIQILNTTIFTVILTACSINYQKRKPIVFQPNQTNCQ